MGQEHSRSRASLLRPHILKKLLTVRFPCVIYIQSNHKTVAVEVDQTYTCSWLLTQVREVLRSDICAIRTQKGLETLDYWLLQATRPIPPLNEPLLAVWSEQVIGPVSPSHFLPIKLIGRGGFSQVFLCTFHAGRKKNTGNLYAVKVMQKAHLRKEGKFKQAHAEIALLSTLSHPFLVRLHWAFQNSQALYLVMNFCPGGELFFHLHNLGRLAEDLAKFYFAEVLLALEYLHANNVIYRDLKPENVLLDIDGHARITDFGLGKMGIGPKDRTNTFCGSPEYMSPEMLRGEGHGRPVDFYCLGALLYEMLTGLPPFFSADRQTMFTRILHDPLPFPSYLSPTVCELIQSLMAKDSLTRLGSKGGVSEVKAAQWLAGVPWDKLLRKQCQPPLVPAIYSSCFSKEYTAVQVDFSQFSSDTAIYTDDEFTGFEYSEEDESTVVDSPGCKAYNIPITAAPVANMSELTASKPNRLITSQQGSFRSLAPTPVVSRPTSRANSSELSKERVKLIDMRSVQYRPVLHKPAFLDFTIPITPPNTDVTGKANAKGPLFAPHQLRKIRALRASNSLQEPVPAHKVPIFQVSSLSKPR